MLHSLCSCSYLFAFLLSSQFYWYYRHIRLKSTAYFFNPPCRIRDAQPGQTWCSRFNCCSIRRVRHSRVIYHTTQSNLAALQTRCWLQYTQREPASLLSLAYNVQCVKQGAGDRGIRKYGKVTAYRFQQGTSAGFWLGESMPHCRLRRRNVWKFDYEMVHSEVYLNKYVVSIAPFSTPACPDCSQNIT